MKSELSTAGENSQLTRRATDFTRPGSWRSFAKLVFSIAGVLILLTGIWKWRYVVYSPAWYLRAHYADQSDLYLGKRNDRSNLELVQQARGYLSDLSRVDASGNLVSPEPLRTQGVRISAKWFERHHPDTVDFNPFEPSGQGSYSVTWRYIPGCQQAIQSSFKTKTDWFDRKGQPCSPVCLMTVVMDPSLKLTTIQLTPVLH